MKIAVFILAGTLALGGCTTAQIERFKTAEAIATTPIDNPITPERLYEAENGAIVVFAGLNTYKNLCVKKVINKSCRQVITSIQIYTKQIEMYLPELRKFVKVNDQVNAVTLYKIVTDAISAARQKALESNVPMGAV